MIAHATASVESLWKELVQSMCASAASEEYQRYPELGARVKRDAARFAALAAPENEKQWQQRRRLAAETRKLWSVYLSELRTGSAGRGRIDPLAVHG